MQSRIFNNWTLLNTKNLLASRGTLRNEIQYIKALILIKWPIVFTNHKNQNFLKINFLVLDTPIILKCEGSPQEERKLRTTFSSEQVVELEKLKTPKRSLDILLLWVRLERFHQKRFLWRIKWCRPIQFWKHLEMLKLSEMTTVQDS